MRYIKDGVISSSPSIPFVSNPSHETILANGWEVYEEPEVEETDWLHDYAIRLVINPLFLQEAVAFVMFIKLSARQLPIVELETGFFHVYCNEIKEDEAPLIELYKHLITVEYREAA